MVCQAMSIAMTVVLPAPVASFRARRVRSGIGIVVGVHEVVEECLLLLSELGGHFGEPDDRLDRLDLAEERPDVLELMMPPVLQQAGGFRGDLPVVRIGELRQRST